MISNNLITRSAILEQKIGQISRQLEQLPPGKIVSSANGKRTKWYIRRDNISSYLPKSQRPLAEQLAARRYLELKLADCTKEKKAVDKYIAFQSQEKKSDLLLSDPRYRDLLAPYYKSEKDYLDQWQKQEYVGNPYHPEQLIHRTPAGYCVRSKSEAMISLALSQRQLPHHYEAPLELHDGLIYPDFTILHPQTHELYYLEHYGMWDDPAYAREAGRKIQRYIANGVFPAINLIITSETADHPLAMDAIEKTLDMYF